MKNFEIYVIVLLVAILALILFAYLQVLRLKSKVEKAEEEFQDIYRAFKKWNPNIGAVFKMFE